MKAAPAAAPLRLRVAVVAADPTAVRRLTELLAKSGHDAADPVAPADVMLTDGSATAAPGLPTVALGSADEDVAGLLPTDAGPAQLDAALRAVAAGLCVHPPPAPQPRFAALPEGPSPALTPREIEVLTALAEGLSNKAAARRLGISPHTVKFHIEQLFQKLGAATRAEAVAKGLRRHIVEF